MHRLPQRRSLAIQTADCLREAIRQGEWKTHLPGLRALSERLQVSLYTLHQALDTLQREGLIRVAQGRRTRILRPSRRKQPGDGGAGLVVALTTSELEQMSEPAHYTIAKLTQSLQAAGLNLRIHADPRFLWQHPSGRLDHLVAEMPSACWVLFSVNEAVQRWFMDQGHRTVIAGSRYPGIRLPAVAQDYEGIGRDAARQLLALGHREAAYLTFHSDREGDHAAERGFREGFLETSGGIEPRILYHDRTLSGLFHVLDTALQGAHPPTALFITASNYALAAGQHLLSRGLLPGRDLSILARDLAPLLDFTVPRYAGYRNDRQFAARKLARLVITLARTGILPRRETRIPWHFVPGETLGPPPAPNPQR